jgi:hypothetical protein
MSALPSSVDYRREHPSLPPNAQTTELAIRPSNGNSFVAGNLIQLDLGQRGFFDPESCYLRYKMTLAGTASTTYNMIGSYAAVFSRMNVYFGSQLVENITGYNQVQTFLQNTHMSVADKYGMQAAYGYLGTTSLADLDGADLTTDGAGDVTHTAGILLPCVLTNADKMIPLFAMPQVRVELQVEALSSIFFNSVTTGITSFTISDVELVYSQVDMGAEVESMVRSAGGDFFIKSQSFTNTSNSLATGANGQYSVVFNQRLESIKSAYLLASPTGNNIWGDAVDITATNGSYQFQIGQTTYPQQPLSTSRSKNAILQSLRKAVGSIYGHETAMSINSVEWSATAATSTQVQPAKFIIGVPTEVLANEDTLMTGVSSNNSAITLNVVSGTATGAVFNLHLILNYDALIHIDLDNGQAFLKK